MSDEDPVLTALRAGFTGGRTEESPPVVKCFMMKEPGSNRQKTILWVCFLSVLSLAAVVRLNNVGSVATLQDSMGPFWAAIRLDGRAHATPYGVAMLLPYMVLTGLSGSLWVAISGLGWLHAFAAPVAWLHSRILDPTRFMAPVIIGCVVALDPGLLDTFRSGAECYLAPLWLGIASMLVGPWAWVAFAFAVGNHPLALVGLPLLIRHENMGRRALWGIGVSIVIIGHQATGWGDTGVGGSGPWSALVAYFSQGGVGAAAVLGAPFVGLFQDRTRPLAVRVIVSIGLLILMGGALGYLRDHHIRMLTIPALVCWTALPGRWIWILGMVFFASRGPPLPPEVRDRPGTLALTHHIGDILEGGARPIVVDRIWFSGGPAVEPSAVMLDRYLRGDVPEDLNVEGDVITIVAADEPQLERVGHPGVLILKGHGFYVARGDQEHTREWSAKHCDLEPRFGGAWDALSVLHPSLGTTDVEVWWACP